MQESNTRWLKQPLYIYGVIIAAIGLVCVVPSVSLAATATESVKGTIDKVLHILQDKEMRKPERTEERRRLIEKTIGD